MSAAPDQPAAPRRRNHRLDDHETDQAWPALVEVWPAFDQHFSAAVERAVFALQPLNGEYGDGGGGAA